MAIELTSVQDEINEIISKTNTPPTYGYKCTIHADGENIPLFSVTELVIERDYDGAYADFITVYGEVPMGTYNKKVIPFQATLEATITQFRVIDSTGEEIIGESIYEERFKAVLPTAQSNTMRGSVSGNITADAADLGGFAKVELQLVSPLVLKLKNLQIGGIYRDVTGGDVLRTILTRESRNAEQNAIARISGVDMVKPSNTTKLNHISIPQATFLLNWPKYIQEKCGGLYNSDVGFYLQGKFWFIYPKLDVTRFSTTKRTMTVIVVPENKYPGLDRTYRETDNQLIVLSTNGIRHKDDSEEQQLNMGNGIRFTNANNIMENFGEVSGNKINVSRSDNNSEFLMSVRADGENRAAVSTTPITDNPYVEMAKLTRANCSLMQFTWSNAKDGIIYPGMPIRVIYANDNNVSEQYGTVMYTLSSISQVGESKTSTRHITQTAVTAILQKTM